MLEIQIRHRITHNYSQQELLAIREHLIHLRFLVESVTHFFQFFVLSYYMSLRSEFRVVMSVTIPAFGSSWPPIVCGRVNVMIALFVFARVFILFSPSCVLYVASFSRLTILIALSMFSNVYFIWTLIALYIMIIM